MSDPRQRNRYRHFTKIATRWHDNDVYGHVHNVVYYSFFDSAVNRLLIEKGGLDIHDGSVIGVVVNSSPEVSGPPLARAPHHALRSRRATLRLAGRSSRGVHRVRAVALILAVVEGKGSSIRSNTS
ncbi:thioesterase family protein [Pseudomonas sp. C1C7]|uniref:acyl-CoA thioesterase n=1 Tax=Pseudomonas sp. C1C7 TaxID=2735272 RepID=UPI002115745E|nr:hypothetical protein [Pseudomonas sp. C1C7]